MCSVDGCERENYKEHEKCILHCQKPEYFDSGWYDSVGEFKKALAEYLAELMCSGFSHNGFLSDKGHKYSFDEVKDLFLNLKKGTDEDSSQLYAKGAPPKIFEALKSRAPTLVGVVFPGVQERDEFGNYLHMLEVFGGIEFMDCTFKHNVWLDLKDVGVLYFKCKFESNHSVEAHPPFPASSDKRIQSTQNHHDKEIDDSKKLPIYRECIFFDTVDVTGEYETRKKFVRNVFEDCEFKKILEMDFCLFINGLLFKDSKPNKYQDFVSIRNCIFESPFLIVDTLIDSLVIEDSIFDNRFSIEYSIVKKIDLISCGFRNTTSLTNITVKDEVLFEKNEFTGRVFFDNSVFCKPLKLSGTTFDKASSFVNAKFIQGLNLDSVTFGDSINFVGAKVDGETSSRTYQIIKDSFDNLGMDIEANKYFSLEKRQRARELGFSKNEIGEKLVLLFNLFFSNFGQSIFRPVVAIFITSTIAGIAYSEAIDRLPLWPIFGDKALTRDIIDALNHWADGLVFSSILKEEYEFISLIFGILLSVFSWMTIVAFKRLTRR